MFPSLIFSGRDSVELVLILLTTLVRTVIKPLGPGDYFLGNFKLQIYFNSYIELFN